MKTKLENLSLWMAVALGSLALVTPGCQEEDPCPPGQNLGQNGLCYRPPNWGEACEVIDECEGGLLCLAPDLPVCTQVNCDLDPDKDTVCPDNYTCIATGQNPPTVCLPGAPTAEECGETAGADDGGVGGAGGAAAEPGTPNPGTPCTMENDPICTGGTFCENSQLKFCTVTGCIAGCQNESICTAAGMACYTGPQSPVGGICITQ